MSDMSNMSIGNVDPDLLKNLQAKIQELIAANYDTLVKDQLINENNIFQEANKKNRSEMFLLIERLLKDGSTVEGIENWKEFHNNFKNGHSSLILAEHKSNLDVVLINYLMQKEFPEFKESFEDILFIAGRKLNEESITVKLFAEMYNRLIVVPKNETINVSEEEMSNIYKINYAVQNFLKERLNDFIYFIYPTATRSRPYEPETYEGITETVNYLKKFDQVIFLSSDGNCLFPLPNTSMEDEPVMKDKIIIRFSKPQKVKDFINSKNEEFIKTHPAEEQNNKNFKEFLTKKITESIYNEKPVPPWKEEWAIICQKIIASKK